MGDTPTPRPLTTDEVVARAKFTISNLSREPAAWWDDEHCLDNGHAAMTVERLVATVEQLQADADTLNEARELARRHDEQSDDIAAWHTWTRLLELLASEDGT